MRHGVGVFVVHEHGVGIGVLDTAGEADEGRGDASVSTACGRQIDAQSAAGAPAAEGISTTLRRGS